MKKFSQMFVKYKKLKFQKTQETILDKNIIESLQTIQMDYDTLKAVDAVLKEKMRKEELNKKVIAAFGRLVPYRKNGKDCFRISFRQNGKQIIRIGQTEEEVLEKCFCFIEEQETTLRSIFQTFHKKDKKVPLYQPRPYIMTL